MPNKRLKNTKKPGAETSSVPGFLRRMGAVFYDSLLLLALWFVATAAILPLNGGEAFASGQILYPLYLLLVSLIFFVWFWTHGGQTLGMRAWKIELVMSDGNPVGWRSASIRFLAALLSWACLGGGFIWIVFDREGLSWHDRLSASRLRSKLEKKTV